MDDEEFFRENLEELDKLQLYNNHSLKEAVVQDKIQDLKTEANTHRRLADTADKVAEILEDWLEELRENGLNSAEEGDSNYR